MKGTNIIILAIVLNIAIGLGMESMTPTAAGATFSFGGMGEVSTLQKSLSNSLKGDNSNWFMTFIGSAVAPIEQGMNFVRFMIYFVSMYMGNIIPVPETAATMATRQQQAIGTVITMFLAFINFSMVKEAWLLIKGARD